jgi:hypothetical protein
MSHGPPEPKVSPQKRLTLARGTCEHCRGPLPDRPNRGSRRRFCSARCRGRAWGATRGRDDGLRAAVETAVRVLQEALGKAPT